MISDCCNERFDGFTGVNGGFTSSDRHVRSIGYQGSTLHDGFGDSVNFASQLGEIPEYFRHLVTTLSASDVDDDIGVGIFRERLRNYSFATTEGAWNCCGTSLDASA